VGRRNQALARALSRPRYPARTESRSRVGPATPADEASRAQAGVPERVPESRRGGRGGACPEPRPGVSHLRDPRLESPEAAARATRTAAPTPQWQGFLGCHAPQAPCDQASELRVRRSSRPPPTHRSRTRRRTTSAAEALVWLPRARGSAFSQA
jgi:hypothetical protein